MNDSATSSGIPNSGSKFRSPTSSGLPKVRQRVPESNEFRPPKSPAASSGVRRVPASQKSGSEFRHPRVPAYDESNLPRVQQQVRHPTNLARIWNSTSDATVTQIRTQILSGDDTASSGLSHHPAVSCNVDPGGRPVTGPSLTLSQEKSLTPSPTQELLIDVLAVAVKDLNLRPGNRNSAWTEN